MYIASFVLKMVSNRFLVKVAIGGAIFTLTSISGMKIYIENKFQRQDFYLKSMDLLRNYEPAEERLGKPIIDRTINIGELHHNYTDGINARLRIPLKGSITNGALYVLASRETPKESWHIDKLDLEIPSHFQRWTFYYDPRDSSKVKITGGSDEADETSIIDNNAVQDTQAS
ncbi:hypothetical protein LOTGIDRAFT_234779 [Lottia gigantea]|uniref:Cytochrome c oxidase assembly factor 1 homolog n=1 Tax=Lottia gigantea TaxID=225164 RepID=V4A437_LOTGI|nr:hypothetical protein LOTGIDRAFT_234779 [Lottia gigantea]ESO88006.1 hypothetical protein LOTGIDRAFT_234779 [Lottia gigantea]